MLELDGEGRLIVMTPTGRKTGARNSGLAMRLLLWADRQEGWKVFDSSTGFLLPDDSVRSPDGSLVLLERWQALTGERRHGFSPVCPDLMVELASPTDERPHGVTGLRRKMAAYKANGARLGWLLLPQERAAPPRSVAQQRGVPGPRHPICCPRPTPGPADLAATGMAIPPPATPRAAEPRSHWNGPTPARRG